MDGEIIPRRGPGHPPDSPNKLEANRVNNIVQAIGLGASYEEAARLGGISYYTLNQWKKRGVLIETRLRGKTLTDEERERLAVEPIYLFYRRVQEAEAANTVQLLALIDSAAQLPQHWQAAAWKLERRFPQRFGRTVVEHAGQIDIRIREVVYERERPALPEPIDFDDGMQDDEPNDEEHNPEGA